MSILVGLELWTDHIGPQTKEQAPPFLTRTVTLREGEWQFLRWFPNKPRTNPAVPALVAALVPALVPAVPALVPGAGSRSSRAGSQSIYSTRTIRQHGPPRADLTKTTTTHVQRHMPTVRGELQSSDGGRPAGAQLYLRVLLASGAACINPRGFSQYRRQLSAAWHVSYPMITPVVSTDTQSSHHDQSTARNVFVQ